MRTGLPDATMSVVTALAIERRPPPEPVRRQKAEPPVPAKAQPRVQMPRAVPPPRELARIEPRAAVAQPRPHIAVHVRATVNTALQQVDFEKTIARLREQNDPVQQSQAPVEPHETVKRFTYDFSQVAGSAPRGEGILEPVQSWQADGYIYYYVRYWVQYPDGTTETGVVPWPLRYLPSQDPFKMGLHHLPLPVPLADYALPSGTTMHPLVAYCYEHRDELSSCPIYHE